MKKTTSVAFCAVSSALISVIMLLGYIPNLTYTIPAVAGLVLMVVLIETNLKNTVATYIVSCVISFFIAETQVKILFIILFGVYPWLKSIIEHIKSVALCYFFKFIFFNAAAVAFYYVTVLLTGVNALGTNFNTIFFYILFLLFANVVFFIYDFALSRVATFYIVRLHSAVKKILKF